MGENLVFKIAWFENAAHFGVERYGWHICVASYAGLFPPPESPSDAPVISPMQTFRSHYAHPCMLNLVHLSSSKNFGESNPWAVSWKSPEPYASGTCSMRRLYSDGFIAIEEIKGIERLLDLQQVLEGIKFMINKNSHTLRIALMVSWSSSWGS